MVLDILPVVYGACLGDTPWGTLLNSWTVLGTGSTFHHFRWVHCNCLSLRAVCVPQTNVSEGQINKTTDNFMTRFWDDGRSIMPAFRWEVHDEVMPIPTLPLALGVELVNSRWFLLTRQQVFLAMMPKKTSLLRSALIYAEVWYAHLSHEETIDDTMLC